MQRSCACAPPLDAPLISVSKIAWETMAVRRSLVFGSAREWRRSIRCFDYRCQRQACRGHSRAVFKNRTPFRPAVANYRRLPRQVKRYRSRTRRQPRRRGLGYVCRTEMQFSSALIHGVAVNSRRPASDVASRNRADGDSNRRTHKTARGHETLDRDRAPGCRRRGDHALLAVGRAAAHRAVDISETRPPAIRLPRASRSPHASASADDDARAIASESAQSGTVERLPATPARFEIRAPATVRSGDTFPVTIEVQALRGIRQLEFSVTYKQSILQLVRSSPGAFAQQGGSLRAFRGGKRWLPPCPHRPRKRRHRRCRHRCRGGVSGAQARRITARGARASPTSKTVARMRRICLRRTKDRSRSSSGLQSLACSIDHDFRTARADSVWSFPDWVPCRGRSRPPSIDGEALALGVR